MEPGKHAEDAQIAADTDPWLWTEDACALLGLTVKTFRGMLTQARRAAERNETTGRHLPLPGDYCSRQVPRTTGHPVRIPNSPRWRFSVLTEWMAQRPGTGWAKGQPSPLRGRPSPRRGRPTHAKAGETS